VEVAERLMRRRQTAAAPVAAGWAHALAGKVLADAGRRNRPQSQLLLLLLLGLMLHLLLLLQQHPRKQEVREEPLLLPLPAA